MYDFRFTEFVVCQDNPSDPNMSNLKPEHHATLLFTKLTVMYMNSNGVVLPSYAVPRVHIIITAVNFCRYIKKQTLFGEYKLENDTGQLLSQCKFPRILVQNVIEYNIYFRQSCLICL